MEALVAELRFGDWHSKSVAWSPYRILNALTGFGSSQVFVNRPGGVHRTYESIAYPETSKSDHPWPPLAYLLEEYCGSDFVFVSFQIFFLYQSLASKLLLLSRRLGSFLF